MRQFNCHYLGCGEGLRRVASRDSLEVAFQFVLTPTEFIGQPDEATKAEKVEVRVSIPGVAHRSMRFSGMALPDPEKLKVLYWHALNAIQADEIAVKINGDSINAFDPNEIEFPPLQPFPVERVSKFGFHA